ncbi:MAG: Asp-tRNA(Asn)/Glu-tRNA(Gln) amidotransferase A subunit family amidase [Gammaproteobacteria bacterium]|jgi:Asp-tRNA(Asn)/Glu-tRNA(Gln) amidotransferase A subunit family amidase
MANLNALLATDAAKGLAAGEFTAQDLMRECLDRVAARDEQVQAWAHIDPEQALSMAQAADEIPVHARGPLHGLPVGIKDIIDTVDMPTENGSPLFRGRQPAVDATCVSALRAAGAIIMGKTVTTELANTNPSKTRNPHNLEHTPGGSSAGSGAGVADHQMPLALGTQTGGSVIRPASYNGVYGLKPTLGLIPRGGVLLQSHTLDTVGTYARSLEDLALVTDAISQPDPLDAHSYLGSRGSLRTAYREAIPSAARLAFLETPAWAQTHDGAKAAILDIVAKLGPACAHESLPAPYDEILDLHGAIFAAENAHYYGDYLTHQPELLSEKLRGRMLDTANVTGREYVNAITQRAVIYQSFQALLGNYDAVLCLSATGPAPHGFSTTGSPAYNSPWTYLGVPCISLPRLTVESLPVGVQLVGLRGAEGHLFKVARWLDEQLS